MLNAWFFGEATSSKVAIVCVTVSLLKTSFPAIPIGMFETVHQLGETCRILWLSEESLEIVISNITFVTSDVYGF
jgi:adenosine/AMP kinase